jgi:hypothetical protein
VTSHKDLETVKPCRSTRLESTESLPTGTVWKKYSARHFEKSTAEAFSKKDSHEWLSFEMQTKRESRNMNGAEDTNSLSI